MGSGGGAAWGGNVGAGAAGEDVTADMAEAEGEGRADDGDGQGHGYRWGAKWFAGLAREEATWAELSPAKREQASRHDFGEAEWNAIARETWRIRKRDVRRERRKAERAGRAELHEERERHQLRQLGLLSCRRRA